MYNATICKLTNIQKHPNADRLMVGNALGYFVIVGLDADSDTLGVVFPSDGKLSEEMLLQNNLYRKHPVTGFPMGGYFEENGRVKSLTLRNAKSEAFWTPLSSLTWTGVNLSSLKEGDTFTELNGKLVCEKYYTPATLHAMCAQKKAAKKNCAPDFAEHIDTGQLRDMVLLIQGKEPVYNVIYTLKVHGTSGRTGYVRWLNLNRNWFQNILAKIGLYKDKFRYVSGTRRVILDPDTNVENGFYAGTEFRGRIHNMIAAMGLRENEILYYEIAGYTDTGSLIMSEHPINKEAAGIDELKVYGDKMSYTYGCEPKEFRVFVYRITLNGEDLPFDTMCTRVEELQTRNTSGIHFEVVPLLKIGNTNDDLMTVAEALTRGKDLLGDHIREGVTLRLEDNTGKLIRILKYKSFAFCVLEGIRKNTDDYVDLEEIM